MITPFDVFDLDLFDLYQQTRIDALSGLQANTDARMTKNNESMINLERRYEYLRLVTVAMWKLVKERTGATDEELRECIERVDLLDGTKDGKISRHRGVIDCASCRRRILRSAIVCVYCGAKNEQGDAFGGT